MYELIVIVVMGGTNVPYVNDEQYTSIEECLRDTSKAVAYFKDKNVMAAGCLLDSASLIQAPSSAEDEFEG